MARLSHTVYRCRMGHRVLIVEDHAAIRNILAAKFKASGFDVRQACDGQEGVSCAEGLRPDLIVLDLAMPVMNGFEAARELRHSMSRVPLLLFTNTPGPIVQQAARSVGIDSVFSKSDSCELLIDDAKRRLGLSE